MVDDLANAKRALAALLAASILLAVVAGLGVGVSAAAHATDTGNVFTPGAGGITNVDYTGTGIAVRQNNTTYVWQNGSTSFTVTILPYADGETHRICLNASAPAGANRSADSEPVYQYGCKEKQPGSSGTMATFELDRLHVNDTGPHRLVATLSVGDHVENASVPIYAIERGGDLDGDGLENEREIDLGTDLNDTDTDSDGLQDGHEVDKYNTDPTMSDTDSDGARDAVEIQRGTDPLDADTDDDGLTDGAEIHEYETDPLDADTDDDGVDDSREIKRGSGATEPSGAGSATDNSTGLPGDRDGPPYWVVVATVLVLSLGGGIVAYSRFDGDVIASLGGGGESSGGADSAAKANRASESTPSDEELLSPEDRVHQLFEEHGGKIKQSEIVERTDWSKAKVSRILSGMEDDGEIERTRIGRENVVKPLDESSDT